jgi:MYXO-CTERM domain-containing protein
LAGAAARVIAVLALHAAAVQAAPLADDPIGVPAGTAVATATATVGAMTATETPTITPTPRFPIAFADSVNSCAIGRSDAAGVWPVLGLLALVWIRRRRCCTAEDAEGRSGRRSSASRNAPRGERLRPPR